MRTKFKSWAMTVAALATTVVMAGPGAAAQFNHTSGTANLPARDPGPEMTSASGAGGGTLHGGYFDGDRVSFYLRASAPSAKPWLATGTFEARHLRPDGTLLAQFGGDVSCLMASNGVAVATGTVTWTRGPGLPGQDASGARVGLTIQDHGRRDQIGWSWWVMGFHQDAPDCLSTAPFFPLAKGNFRVDAPPRPGRVR